MAFSGLQDFIACLERSGELKRITCEVDPELEITEIASRIMKDSGPALFFEKVKGSDYPLVINTLGSEKRMALALNAESLDAKAKEIEDLLRWIFAQAGDIKLLKTLPEALAKLPLAMSLIPKKVGRPPCQEIIDDESGFDSLPALKCWPHDGGRFLTLPLVCTEDTESGAKNMGMYRMQIYDNRTAGMHWHLHKDGARFFEKYKEKGTRMPIAVALGCDPAVSYASTAPLPEGIWELIFAGFLR
jgi:4-hydroxy-3-polyprenylbenzoate decarboxylase